ncbi:hypothetical protein ACE40V_23815, partial [Salmonella enterica]|uniref:hypothetical protein n=1 Tax=Salmonella enterica TaxID=28901 RepID=UPI003D2C2044
HEDTLRVFAHYGRSTKRGTNEQTGQLGIGSKSAFCYTDSYQITSFFNGVVNVYDAHIDESNIGVVTRIVDNEPTDEENGILISLRVNVRDVQT